MDTLFEMPPAAAPGDEPVCSVSDEHKFDWRSDDSIILGYQPATAVYRNTCNAVVIRQEGTGYDDDQFVILRDAAAVRLLVGALQSEIKGEH